MQSIADCLGQHTEEHAFVFGKGPSLDSFDLQLAGPLRICINEAASCIPNPTYFFSHDKKPIEFVTKKWPTGCIAVLEHSRAAFARKCNLPESEIRVYSKRHGDGQFLLAAPERIASAGALYGCSGTVHSALHFCKLIGASRVTLVGFDGTGGYARILGLPPGGSSHDRILRDSVRSLHQLEIPFSIYPSEEINTRQESARSTKEQHDSLDYAVLYDNLRSEGYHENDLESTHLKPYIPWIKRKLKFETVLDVGCSSGGALPLLADNPRMAFGVDVSSLAIEKGRALGRNLLLASATKLPFPDGRFDLVVSSDVMEHLHPDDASLAMQECLRVAKRFVFLKIATRVDITEKWKRLAGHPLHLTTRPIGWWIEHFKGHGRVIFRQDEAFCVDLEG